MRAVAISLVLVGLTGLAACQRMSESNSKAAVKAAIEERLKQRPNVVFQNVTVEVGDVAFNGDTAEAQVKFRSKQAPGLAVGMQYKLRRAGNGWQVESSSPTSMPGTSPHGNTAGPMPPPSPAEPGPQPSH